MRRLTETSRDQLSSFLHGSDEAIWATAAVVLAIQWTASEEQQAAAQAVVTARGLHVVVAALGAQEASGLGLPMLAGPQEAFADRARMLDVGTGVAAMAVAYAELFPRLTVVGINVMPRVLALAEQTVAESAVSDRVILREQGVSSLDEPETYDLAWLPAPFLPESALGVGVDAFRAW